ncbi:MAG: putative lipoprotein [Myxococcales bacterium]|nr:putative lipoprotein [Myxococcales bacterium]
MRKLWPILLVGVLACDKGGAAGGSRDEIIAAWKKGGLSPSAMTPATVPVGKDCQSGTVGAIDVLLCVYPSAADAKAAEESGLAWVGDTTGAAQANGSVLIAIADRRKSDPTGRTINQLMKLAPK